MIGKTELIIGVTVAVTLNHVITSDATAALWVCKNADGRTQIRDWPCDDPSILPHEPGRDIRPQPAAPARSETPPRPDTPSQPAAPSRPAASADATPVSKPGVSAPAADVDAERAKPSATTTTSAGSEERKQSVTSPDSEGRRKQTVTPIFNFDERAKPRTTAIFFDERTSPSATTVFYFDSDARRGRHGATTTSLDSEERTNQPVATTIDSEETRQQRVTVVSDFDPPPGKRSTARFADAKKRATGKNPKRPETHKASDVAKESHAKVLRSVKSKCETGLQAAGRAGASCN